MSYFLGLHINDNYIKYAKIKIEDNKEPKVETYGVDFYDNLQLALDRIIGETYSFDVELAINLNDENYYNFEAFSGMNYADLKKHISLVFAEDVCVKNNYLPSSFETRFVRIKNDIDQDATKVVYIAANKASLLKTKQLLKSKAKKILPLPLANLSLIDSSQNGNYVILDIDTITTLTIVVKGCIKDIITINLGMDVILEKMKKIYKSFSKSYAQCKNIILMNDGMSSLFNRKDSESDINNFDDTEIVVPILSEISNRVNEIMQEYVGIVNKIYLTGSAVIMNNIDLYFENSLDGMSVELLKPYFVVNNIEVSQQAKEIIEVNSAIALAVSPNEINADSINFAKKTIVNMQAVTNIKGIAFIYSKVQELKSKFIATIDARETKKRLTNNIEETSKKQLFTVPIRIMLVILFSLIAYIITGIALNNRFESYIGEVDSEIVKIQSQISSINSDITYINTNKQKYKILENNVKNLLTQLNQVNGLVNDVPSFLTRLALIIPDEVIITSIEVDGELAIIEAQSVESAPLGFFISGLKEEYIMYNVVTEIVEDPILQKVIIRGVVK